MELTEKETKFIEKAKKAAQTKMHVLAWILVALGAIHIVINIMQHDWNDITQGFLYILYGIIVIWLYYNSKTLCSVFEKYERHIQQLEGKEKSE